MSDAHALTARLAELLQRERVALADFLLGLAEFDRLRAWESLGHASLFDFLHRTLGLSRGAAHYRKTAAGLVQAYPELIEPIRDGRLCITSIIELARVITPENRHELVPRFFHRSRSEAAAIAAEIRPAEAPARRELVTVLPVLSVRAPRPAELPLSTSVPDAAPNPATPGPESAGAVAPYVAAGEAQPSHHGAASSIAPGRSDDGHIRVQPVELDGSAAATLTATPPREEIQPLTAELRRLHVTVSKRFLEKLSAARAALSHARPGASAEQILEAGLDLLLAAAAKKKALVARPRTAQRTTQRKAQREPQRAPRPEHVPAAVKREVWARDQGRCQWPLASGGICGSTLRCELDHVVPKARGGPATASNLRVLCRAHNQRAARLEFGDSWMERFTRAARAKLGGKDVPAIAASGAS